MRAYTQLVAGVSEVTRQRAQEARQGAGSAARQVSGVAQGVVAAGRAGGDVLLQMLRAEVGRSAGRLGLTSPGEVDRLRRRVEALERRLQRVEGDGLLVAPAAGSTGSGAGRRGKATR